MPKYSGFKLIWCLAGMREDRACWEVILFSSLNSLKLDSTSYQAHKRLQTQRHSKIKVCVSL